MKKSICILTLGMLIVFLFIFMAFAQEKKVVILKRSPSPVAQRKRLTSILNRFTRFHVDIGFSLYVIYYDPSIITPWVDFKRLKEHWTDKQADAFKEDFVRRLRFGRTTAFLVTIINNGYRPISLNPLSKRLMLVDNNNTVYFPVDYEKQLDSPIMGMIQGLVFFPPMPKGIQWFEVKFADFPVKDDAVTLKWSLKERQIIAGTKNEKRISASVAIQKSVKEENVPSVIEKKGVKESAKKESKMKVKEDTKKGAKASSPPKPKRLKETNKKLIPPKIKPLQKKKTLTVHKVRNPPESKGSKEKPKVAKKKVPAKFKTKTVASKKVVVKPKNKKKTQESVAKTKKPATKPTKSESGKASPKPLYKYKYEKKSVIIPKVPKPVVRKGIAKKIVPPSDVARRYISAWIKRDFAHMYELLSNSSKKRVSFSAFKKQILSQKVNESFLRGLRLVKQEVRGENARVVFKFTSKLLFIKVSRLKVLHLVREDGRWGILWSER